METTRLSQSGSTTQRESCARDVGGREDVVVGGDSLSMLVLALVVVVVHHSLQLADDTHLYVNHSLCAAFEGSMEVQLVQFAAVNGPGARPSMTPILRGRAGPPVPVRGSWATDCFRPSRRQARPSLTTVSD